MRAFADQIAAGLRARGYKVRELTAPVFLGGLLPRSHPAAKWLGYVDQFLIFPPWLRLQAGSLPPDSLCVLSDQALGPWCPWLGGRPHMVHTHDLLALEAAMRLQPFHHLSRTGRWYQRWIRWGFRHALCFLSVSAATQEALKPHLTRRPLYSAVLYNQLPSRFVVLPGDKALNAVVSALPAIGHGQFLFHIGSTWYKNRLGVLHIWGHLHRLGLNIHLIMTGSTDPTMQAFLRRHPNLSPWLHVLDRPDDHLVVALYNSAAALLFPSHAEGFGWPILEALACGCPVITTDRAPMTEVGGEAAEYIPAAPAPPEPLDGWALKAAHQVANLLTRHPVEQNRIRKIGLAQARRFPDSAAWLDQLEAHYQRALALQAALPRNSP